ncbi:MAG: ArsR family transcriptional regulator [Thermoplasmata archaeon]|nr:ArsR family transcriptional regulator [Thermoplasmata archaeon]
MAVEMKANTMGARIIRILLERYPVTVEEITEELKLSPSGIEHELARLVSKGYISMQPLPDKTYILLLRMDFRFIGLNESQRRALKHKGKKKGGRQRRGSSTSDHMYG